MLIISGKLICMFSATCCVFLLHMYVKLIHNWRLLSTSSKHYKVCHNGKWKCMYCIQNPKSPDAYPPQPAAPSSETHSLALELVSKNKKIVEIWQTFLSNSTLQTGIFYKNVTDKVFEVLEELGIWLCHNGGNETI